jgi:hypothetical protein
LGQFDQNHRLDRRGVDIIELVAVADRMGRIARE